MRDAKDKKNKTDLYRVIESVISTEGRNLFNQMLGFKKKALIAIILFCGMNCSNKINLTIKNKSGWLLKDIKVGLVNRDKIEIKMLKQNTDTTITITKYSDDSYFFQTTINDSVHLKDSLGYVTHGMNFQDTITMVDSITHPLIKLKQNPYIREKNLP